jgi:hypothetical protein
MPADVFTEPFDFATGSSREPFLAAEALAELGGNLLAPLCFFA